MRLEWLPRAQGDIASIIAYISQDSPAAALRQVRSIRERAEILTTYPFVGRPGRASGTRELVVSGTPYLLIYRVKGETAQLMRVIHGAQRWPPRKDR